MGAARPGRSRTVPTPFRAPARGLPPCRVSERIRRDSSHRSANASPDRSLLGADASCFASMALRTVCEGGVQAEHRRGSAIFRRRFRSRSGGVAILPGEACDGMPPDLQCCPISNLEPVQVVLAYRQGAPIQVQNVVMEIATSLRHFEQRRKIFSRAVRSAKRPVVSIASKRPRTDSWRASNRA